jgi:hypothetical protein
MMAAYKNNTTGAVRGKILCDFLVENVLLLELKCVEHLAIETLRNA